jgi:hypothetical protein
MQSQLSKRSDSDKLRTHCVHVRLTARELDVLDKICKTMGGRPRAEVARLLMTMQVPASIPERNQATFAALDQIQCVLHEVVEQVEVLESGSEAVLGWVQEIENLIGLLRSQMLGAT